MTPGNANRGALGPFAAGVIGWKEDVPEADVPTLLLRKRRQDDRGDGAEDPLHFSRVRDQRRKLRKRHLAHGCLSGTHEIDSMAGAVSSL